MDFGLLEAKSPRFQKTKIQLSITGRLLKVDYSTAPDSCETSENTSAHLFHHPGEVKTALDAGALEMAEAVTSLFAATSHEILAWPETGTARL